jgi:hypothetical protein
MTPETQPIIDALTAEARTLHDEIKSKQKRLKEIEAKLAELADTLPPEPLKDATRDGYRRILRPTAGRELTYRTTAPALIASFPAGGEMETKVRSLTGPHFDTLFAARNTYARCLRDGAEFIAQATLILRDGGEVDGQKWQGSAPLIAAMTDRYKNGPRKGASKTKSFFVYDEDADSDSEGGQGDE